MAGNRLKGSKYRAHMVLIPFFSASHSIPFFDFATRLAASAVKVTILSAEYHVHKVWSDALYWNWAPRLRAAAAEDGIELVAVQDGIYDGTWRGFSKVVNDEASQAQLVAAFRAHLEPLMAMSPAPCCIVSDMFVGWAQALADQFDIPRFLLHIQPASHLSLMLHVPELVAEGRLPLTEENGTEPMAIPGFKNVVQPWDLVAELRDEEVIKMGGYDTFLRMATQARRAPLVLVNTFRELEEDVFLAFDLLHTTDPQFPKVIPIGPVLLPQDYPSPAGIGGERSEENRSLMQWLDLQPPRSVLYIAFGTLVRNSEERVKEIALALEASQQPFLWAAGTPIKRPNEPPPLHVSEFLPPGFEERTQKQGKVATMVVPQIHILRHPACGAFLSHCGWNSVLESITSGVPLIAWPQQYEQFMTARYLIDTANVAAELVEVRRGFGARDEIQRVVQLVMHEAEGAALRSRAAKLKQFAACYAYSNTNLNTFLAGMAQMNGSI